MITVRAISDPELLYEAYSWMESAPDWFYEAGPDFWLPDFVMFREMAGERLDFGVFEDDEFAALIMLTERSKGSYEIDLAAKKGTDAGVLGVAACRLREELFRHGVREIHAWVYAKNRGVMRVCEAGGMKRDGVRVFKGTVRNRPAEWIRLSSNYLEVTT